MEPFRALNTRGTDCWDLKAHTGSEHRMWDVPSRDCIVHGTV